MAKSSNQKLKLLYLIKILSEQSDENHCMSAQRLIDELARYDIKAERKSIYDDINCLNYFGYDIIYVKSRTDGGYYLASRDFELPELKLLVDAVQASRFITQKKSKELISKIEKLAGPYDAKKLQRQVLVAGRIKTENESIYYNVDKIHNAIQDNTQISFVYLKWNPQKELKPRKDGNLYRVSPLALTWKDENYYLIAFDDNEEKIKHFRVDKMSQISQLFEMPRQGLEEFGKLDVAEYTNKTFGMFGGEATAVTLLLPQSMAGIILDRFGKEISIRQMKDDFISARIKVAVSNQFYGWLTGLGEQVTIIGPENVRINYLTYIKDILQQYEGKEA